MPTSQEVTQIQGAIQAAQAAGLIAVSQRRNSQTNSHYANLTDCVEALLPAMKQHGLGFMQFLGGIRFEGGIHVCGLTTRIIHVSGEWIEVAGEFPMGPPPVSKSGNQILNHSQNHGLALTYAKRYALVSAFGMPTGDDDDAQRLTSQGPQPQKEETHWSAYVNSEWANEFAPGTKTPLRELNEDEMRIIWRDHHKTFPPIVARLADKIANDMEAAGLSFHTMEKPNGTPENLLAMTTKQLLAFASHVRLVIEKKKGGA